jgi:transcriptional regulator with XRE-family HTH domain
VTIDHFGGRLKELREQAGLTQEQLAHAAGLTKDGIAQLEQGRRSPSWETVLAVAEALKVSCEAFAVAPVDRGRPAIGRPRKPDAAAGKPVASENTELANVTWGKAKVAKGKKGKGK